jgi:hypothetical protein
VTQLERIAAELGAAVLAILAVLLWWHLHNLAEQRQGAQACIQQTTITKQAAAADSAGDEAAQAAIIKAVVGNYDAKLASLSASNADLAGRLSAALRAQRLPGPGPAAGATSAQPGLPAGQAAAADGSAKLAGDIDALLQACDAAQLKGEDLAVIYQDMRDRAIAARKKAAL